MDFYNGISFINAVERKLLKYLKLKSFAMAVSPAYALCSRSSSIR